MSSRGGVLSCVRAGVFQHFSVGAVALLVGVADPPAWSQDRPSRDSDAGSVRGDGAIRGGGNAKALKYFRVLEKRPSPGYLFDRFYNAWLDTDTVEGLEGFLKAQLGRAGDTPHRLLLAFFYTRQGENVRALEQFRAALEKDPGSADAWYQKALVEQRTLDFSTAIEDLDKALAASPKAELERDILQLQGRLHARSGDVEKARAAWSSLLEKHPEDEELQEDLIELQLAEGLYEQALATAQALVEKTKDPYLVVVRRLRLGDIHQGAGRQEKALEAYATSLERVGSETWIENEIIGQVEQVFRREDDITGLKAYLEKLLETYPKRIGLRRKHVAVLTELGDKEGAKRGFSEILKLTPGDRSVREDYVDMLAKLELRDEAMEQLQALVELHPDDGELLVKLANLQNSAGDPAGAAKTVERFLEGSDESEYTHLRAIRLLERFEQLEAADATFKQLLSRFEESDGARDAYANYLHRHDRKEEAVATWKSLAEGGDRETVVRIARSLASRGESSAAFDLLEARFEVFSGDTIYLKQLIDVAVRLRKFELAWPWARQLVALSTTPAELETAVALTTRVTKRLERGDELRGELEGARTPQELCLLAELYEVSGDFVKADALLETVATSPEKGASLFAFAQKIRMLTLRQDFEGAAAATADLIGKPGGRRTANVQKAVELYRRAFLYDKALEWVPTWKTLSPGSTSPWLAEARLLLARGDEGKAVDVLRRATQAFEGNQDVRANLAEVYTASGKLADAARIYNQLYDEASDVDAKIRWVEDLARVAEMRGKSRTLVEQFEERRRTNRNSIVPLLALAEIHRVADNYEDRRRALLEATRVKPGDLELLLQVARIEEAEQQYGRALATLESALKEAGNQRDKVLERVAKLHFAAGDDDKGFQILQDLVGRQNLDPESALGLAQAMCSMGDWTHAVDFLEPLRGRFPEDYRFAYLYAIALEEDQKDVSALEAFVAVLGAKTELPSTKGASTSGARGRSYPNGYIEAMRKVVPATAVSLLEFQQQIYTAYMHRRMSRRSMVYRSGRGGNLSYIQIPGTLGDLRGAALAHIGSLARQIDEEGAVEDLKVFLAATGIPYARYVLDLDLRAAQRGNFALQLLEKHPDDEAILALVILTGVRGGAGIAIESLRKAFDLFRDTRQELAFMAAIAAALYEGDEATTLLNHAFEMLEELKEPTYFTVMAALAASGNPRFSRGGVSQLTEDQKRRLMAKVMGWYAGIDTTSWGPYLFSFIASSMLDAGDPGGFVRFLDEEVARAHENGPNPQQTSYFGGRNEQLIGGVEFPPALLSEFPPQVLGLFSPDRNPFGVELELDPETFEGHFESARSPILNVLLLYLAERNGADEGRVEAALAELTALEQPELDVLLLAAAYSAQDQDGLPAAIALLRRAQYLPMTREKRQMIDGSIVAWSLEGRSVETAKAEPMLAAGREAALRLRRARLSTERREELVAAMEELGMNREAEKLEARAVASTPDPMRGILQRFRRGGGQDETRVTRLLSAGKRDQAAALLAKEVEGLGKMGLQLQTVFQDRYELSALQEQIPGKAFAKEVLKRLEPGESADSKRQAQWGFACEALGETERAIAIYRKVAEARPRDVAIRFRLIRLLATADFVGAPELIRSLKTRDLIFLGEQAGQWIGDDTVPYLNRLAFLEVLFAAFDELEDSSRQPVHWAPQVLDGLAYDSHVEGMSLGNLYQSEEAYDARSSERGNELQRQRALEYRAARRAAHDRICRRLLTNQQLCREGFRRLSAFAPPTAEDEVAAKLAVDVLLEYEVPRGMGGGRFGSRMWHGGSGGQTLRQWLPEDYLVRHSWAKQDRSVVDTEVRPALAKKRGAERKAILDRLEHQLELFFCANDGFIAEAETLLKERNGRQLPLQDGRLAVVVDAWRARGLDIDLSPLVLDTIRRGKKHGYDPDEVVSDYLDGERARKGEDGVTAFISKLSEVYFGPAEGRGDRFAKFVQANARGRASNMDFHTGLNLLQQLAQQPALYFAASNYFEDQVVPFLGTAQSDWQMYPDEHPLMDQEAYTDFDATVARLERSAFLGDRDALRFYVWQEDAPENSFFASVANVIQATTPALRKKYIAFLEGNDTFGAQLLILLTDPRAPGWHAFLEKHGAALRERPESRATVFLAAYVRNLGASVTRSSRLQGTSRETFEWLRDLRGEERGDEIERILAAKSLRSVGMETHQLLDASERYFQLLLPGEREKAVRLFWKIAEFLERENRSGRMYYGQQTFTGNLLSNALSNQRESGLPVANFIFDVLSTPNPRVPVGLSNEYLLQNTYNQALRAASSDRGRDTNARLAKALKAFGDGIDAKYHRVSTRACQAVLARIVGNDANRLNSIRPFLETQVSEGAHPALARELLFLAALRAQVLTPVDSRKGTLERETEHFLALLDDSEIPLALRLDTTSVVMESAGNVLPMHAMGRAFAVLEEAWDAKLPFDANTFEKVTRHLLSQEREKDEAWRTAATQLLGAWKKHVLFRRTQGRGRQQELSGEWLGPMLRVSVHLSDNESMNQIVAKSQNLQDGAWLVLLLRIGTPEQVMRILVRGWAALDWRVVQREGPGHYNKAVTEKLPAVLELLENEDFRFFLESFVASLPDAPGATAASRSSPTPSTVPPFPSTRTSTARDKRLVALARRVAEHEFQNPEVEEAVLGFLAESRPAADLVADRMSNVVSRVGVIALTGGASGYTTEAQRTRRQKLLQMYVRQSLVTGPEAIWELLSELLEASLGRGHQQSNAASELLEAFVLASRSDAVDWLPEVRTKNTSLWTRVLSHPKIGALLDNYQFSRPLAAGFLFAALEGDAALAEFDNAFGKLDQPIRESLVANSNFSHAVLEHLPPAIERRTLAKEERLRLLRVLHSHPMFADSSQPAGGSRGSAVRNVLPRLQAARLVTREELLEFGPALVRGAPRGGYAAAELAEVQAQAKNYAAAVGSYDEALEHLDPDASADYSRFHLEKARILKESGKAREALATLTSMDADRLDTRNEEPFDRLRLELEIAVSVADGNELEAIGLASRQYAEARENGEGEGQVSRVGVALQELATYWKTHGESAKASAYLYLAAAAYDWAAEEGASIGGRLDTIHEELMVSQAALGKIPVPVELLKRGATWKYLDGGAVPGSRWRTLGFDDSGWKEGVAKFGYGDGDETTTLDYGTDARNKAMTTYFRKVIEVKTPADVPAVTLAILRDDGVVVYLNGKAIARDNLPDGDVDSTTPASATVAGVDEGRYFPRQIDVAAHWVAGKNIIAVELHQKNGRSSDVGFDMNLRANVLPLREVLATVEKDGLQATLGDTIWGAFEADVIARLATGRAPEESKNREPAEKSSTKRTSAGSGGRRAFDF